MLDIVNKNDYDFPVEMVELQAINADGLGAEDNYKVPKDLARACVRTDTGKVLGIHGSKYNPINHSTVVNTIETSVDKMLATLNKSIDSEDIDYKVNVYDNGAKMRGSYTFKNLVIQPKLDDIVAFRINFFNSYDQSWAFQSIADGLRLWCLNGCTTPATATKVRYKHTTKVSIDCVKQKMIDGFNYFNDQEGTFKMYALTDVQDHVVESFFKQTLCKTFTRSTSSLPWNMFQFEELMRQYDKEKSTLGRNLWAVYNTMTHWATHVGNHKTQKRREDEVAKALSSPQSIFTGV